MSEGFIRWQIDNPSVEVCGDLHPREYMEQVLGLKVLDYRGSMMGGFVIAHVEDVPADLPRYMEVVDRERWDRLKPAW